MAKPPEDDSIDQVLRQVSDALSSLGLGDASARSDVLDGVRDALRTLRNLGGEDGGPRVMVFEGGHERPEEPEASEEGPGLRVVDTEEVERIRQREQSEVRVRVLKGPQAHTRPLPAEGRIRVAWEDGERPWQTVYRGEAAHAYRLSCDQGNLELSVDGMSVDRILEGQTVDLEARVIRLRAASGADAAGRYVRLA